MARLRGFDGGLCYQDSAGQWIRLDDVDPVPVKASMTWAGPELQVKIVVNMTPFLDALETFQRNLERQITRRFYWRRVAALAGFVALVAIVSGM